MSDFLYFVSGNIKAMPAVKADEIGLEHFHDGRPIEYREAAAGSPGPSGSAGLFFGVRDARKIVYDKNRQVWKPYPGLEGVYFGYETDDPPTPAGLQRSKLLDGYEWTNAGRTWTVPVAKLYSVAGWAHALPRKIELSESGTYQAGEIIARYKPLWEIAEQIQNVVATAKDSTIRLPENAIELAVAVLSFNYRIGPAEFAELEIAQWDFETVWGILRLVIDQPGFLEALEKKTGASA